MREQFEINAYGTKVILLVLKGDMDDSPEVSVRCREVLEKIPRSSHVVVDASEISLISEGVRTWVEAVETFLMESYITYAPSQLACILKYSDSDHYKHPASEFPEDD